MGDQSGAPSSSEQLNLEALRSLTKELTDMVTSSNDFSQVPSSESEKSLTDYVRKLKQISAEASDFGSLGSEELDTYLRDANEELQLVVAANSKMYDEIGTLSRTYVEDYARLEGDIEGLSCSLKFIESQGLKKLENDSHVECSTSIESQEKLMNAYEGYKFEVLELDDKIEKNKVFLSYLKDLDYSLKGIEAVDLVEDIFTTQKVIEFEGNCIRLSLKTFIPKSEDLLSQQKLDCTSDYSIRDHELLIEFSDGTMELKSVEIFPDDVVLDEIIDALKSSRIPSMSTTVMRSTLEWLVREVQNLIILSTRNRLWKKDAEKLRN